MRLEWRDAFGVGHAGLDAQHQDLIARINRLCMLVKTSADGSMVQQQLRALIEAVRRHFDYETAVLRELARNHRATVAEVRALTDAGIAEHAVEHGRVLSELWVIAAIFERNVATASDELVKWFLDHAIGQDAYLKMVFQTI